MAAMALYRLIGSAARCAHPYPCPQDYGQAGINVMRGCLANTVVTGGVALIDIAVRSIRHGNAGASLLQRVCIASGATSALIYLINGFCHWQFRVRGADPMFHPNNLEPHYYIQPCEAALVVITGLLSLAKSSPRISARMPFARLGFSSFATSGVAALAIWFFHTRQLSQSQRRH
jgi:hypothetical protein